MLGVGVLMIIAFLLVEMGRLGQVANIHFALVMAGVMK